MKLPFRRSSIQAIDAEVEFRGLENSDFWAVLGDRFDTLQENLHNRLKQEGNTRDEDMSLKGQLKGYKDAQFQLGKLISELKSRGER